jgi:predicted nuclease of restriction endonuclease-like (RecB) superfamily
VYALRIQLTWTHLRSLMGIEDELKRKFYLEMTRIEHWDTRTLDEKIDSLLYERTALSRKPEELIQQELQQIQVTNTLTPDVVFRSSYFLDTLGLSDTYSERDL